MERRASAFARKVHVDGEKPSRPIQRLPFGHQWLPAINPGGVQWIDQAGIESEGGAWKHLVGRGGGAGSRRAQTQNAWIIEVCRANVATGLATICVVSWVNVSKGVRDRGTGSSDGTGEGRKSEVGRDN